MRLPTSIKPSHTFFQTSFKGARRITRRRSPVVRPRAEGFEIRPYHVRKGDTLDTIASKRELDVKELLKLNHGIKPKDIKEGKTILLPAGRLSARDKEIIKGIGLFSYRLYPVRKGEKIEDIMKPRRITRDELEKLNPSVKLDRLTANQVIKLPANKFTLREREVLIGNNVLPPEFFGEQGKIFGAGLALALTVAGLVAWWQRDYAAKENWLDDEH